MTRPERIYISELDVERIERVLECFPRKNDFYLLEEELARAIVVAPSAMPPDTVTMNSRISFKDVQTGDTREISVVYPEDADAESGRISVLAPVGSALLGLHTGDVIEWPLPSGNSRTLRIESVLYQPEAQGHYHL